VILLDWKVVLETDEDGWITVTVPSLPGCISQGKTKEKALENIKEAIELHLSALAEEGVPLKDKKEVAMVNVCI
jgi:predicted RNase H-like HicB family nuclease